MPTEWKWVVCVAWLAAAPVTASAQEQTCTYGGQQYDEGVTICQAGLRQTCMNGTWQNLDGERCDGDDDGDFETE